MAAAISPATSRYLSDFEEILFLGKGAFGEVVKVRNKIDGRYYAVKRIRLDAKNVEHNRKILREVMTLSRLQHERIIRYFQAWIEGGGPALNEGFEEDEKEESSLSSSSSSSSTSTSFLDDDATATLKKPCKQNDWLSSGLKFYNCEEELMRRNPSLSSLINFDGGGEAQVQFEHLSLVESSEESSAASHQEQIHHQQQQQQQQFLYIQMEFCPNQTLRDVIDEGILEAEDCWRLFRQILEGLAHIHAQGMIHRDLKPSNIFLDSNGNVKIGDFGLAITGGGSSGPQQQPPQKHQPATSPTLTTEEQQQQGSDSLTGGIGTPFYVSPEQEDLRRAKYNQKVDMYSLGVIFVELWCPPFKTGMERVAVLRDARKPEVILPDHFASPGMERQVAIARNLLCHDPQVRLTSEDLLKSSEWLPPKMEDEYVLEAIRSVSTPGTPYYDRLLEMLFAQQLDPHKDFTYDYNLVHINIGKLTIITLH